MPPARNKAPFPFFTMGGDDLYKHNCTFPLLVSGFGQRRCTDDRERALLLDVIGGFTLPCNHVPSAEGGLAHLQQCHQQLSPAFFGGCPSWKGPLKVWCIPSTKSSFYPTLDNKHFARRYVLWWPETWASQARGYGWCSKKVYHKFDASSSPRVHSVYFWTAPDISSKGTFLGVSNLGILPIQSLPNSVGK